MAGRAERRLRGYSKGMRQRIKLAQALVHDPALLILDEPLSGIDPIGRAGVGRPVPGAGRAGANACWSPATSWKSWKNSPITWPSWPMDASLPSDTVSQIRDLLDDHPLSILVASDRCRELAGVLLDLSDVVGVDLWARPTP